jgi:predicted nucleic acid-binding protein
MDKKLRIYLETSIISHLDAPDRPDRMAETQQLWNNVLAGKYDIVIGEPVLVELHQCHEPKRSFMLDELDKIVYDYAEETDESKRLATAYIRVGGLPGKSWTDATHIALATLANCDVIVSWNFSHIVNIRAITVVDAINTSENLRLVRILPPTVLLGGQAYEQIRS